ncbi:hypothetical protein FHG87_021031 [Trinorchestia longiramus]|nr:hypothetical protein FHG87_021031 [Trinorchestia longiramus]
MYIFVQGAALLSRMTAQVLRGERQDACTGFCIIHYSDPDRCGLGLVSAACKASQTSLGQFDSGCHCCVEA